MIRIVALALAFFLVAAVSSGTDRPRPEGATEELEIFLQQAGVKTETPQLIRWVQTAPPTAPRWAAVEILGLRGAKEATPVLRAILASKKEDILLRETSALALARLGDPKGKPALREFVHDSKDWSRQIFLAARLAELGDASGYPYVAKASISSSVDLRFLSAAALVAFIPLQGKASEEIDPAERLLALARDEDPKIRGEFLVEAGTAVSRGADRKAFVSAVREISVGDPDPGVRERAGLILIGLKAEEAQPNPAKTEGI